MLEGLPPATTHNCHERGPAIVESIDLDGTVGRSCSGDKSFSSSMGMS